MKSTLLADFLDDNPEEILIHDIEWGPWRGKLKCGLLDAVGVTSKDRRETLDYVYEDVLMDDASQFEVVRDKGTSQVLDEGAFVLRPTDFSQEGLKEIATHLMLI